MTTEHIATRKTMLQKTNERRRGIRERCEAISDVSWRQHAQLASEPSRTPPVVGNRDQGGELPGGKDLTLPP
jgi:hypothetical protein